MLVKRFSMVLLTMLLAVITLLLAAKNPTGPNTVSFDEPAILWSSLGLLVALFLPPLVLSFFNHLVVKIISAIYQAFIVISFLGIILVGFIIPDLWIIVIGVAGVIVSTWSSIVTILVGLKKRNLVIN